MTMTAGSPILLLQWLTNPDDGNEAATAFSNFRSRLDVSYVDVGEVNGGKEMVHDTLVTWATNNPNCQCIYIGCHGFEDRLGSTGVFPDDESGIIFRELWDWLQEAHKLHRRAILKDNQDQHFMLKGEKLKADEGRFDLWFGACRSASAKECWSPLSNLTKPWPVQAIVGFEDKPRPSQVAVFLETLMAEQRLNVIRWSHDTWQSLIEGLPHNQPVVFTLKPRKRPAQWVKPYGYR